MRDPEPFAGGCGRVGAIDPITVEGLAALAQDRLGALCVPPLQGPAVQVKYTRQWPDGPAAGSDQRLGRQPL